MRDDEVSIPLVDARDVLSVSTFRKDVTPLVEAAEEPRLPRDGAFFVDLLSVSVRSRVSGDVDGVDKGDEVSLSEKSSTRKPEFTGTSGDC